MGPRRLAVYGTALVVLALDQVTKWLVVSQLADRPPVRVIGSFVRLRHTTNTGGAFSLFAGFPLFFAVMAVLVMLAIAVYARRVQSIAVLVTLGLLLGGALGNFADRLLRGDGLLNGEVVDFVDVGAWPVFNLADSCITVGAVLLALLMGRAGREPEPAGRPTPDRPDPGTTPTSR
jgi:signal peptidase II